jgi:MoxR-like ATPase
VNVAIKDKDQARLEDASIALANAKSEIAKCIYGQEQVIEQVLVTLLSGGHGLLVGLPGLAKTLLVETLATVLGLDERRVQFTPDLMPADILGSEVLDESDDGKRRFRFLKGPVFCQLLMADEINRASPRTQSALLQAMQENAVTVAGEGFDLPRPFHVLATQNPIEQEGTYPLPEAQLDRFFMQVNVDYPSEAEEREILVRTTGSQVPRAGKVLNARELQNLQALVREIPVGEKIVDAILKLVRSARPGAGSDSDIVWGPSPRAAQALMLGIRARAILDGRLAPSIDDVISLSPSILRHRMALSFAARADGITVDHVIATLAKKL